jgi:hypothetical protein
VKGNLEKRERENFECVLSMVDGWDRMERLAVCVVGGAVCSQSTTQPGHAAQPAHLEAGMRTAADSQTRSSPAVKKKKDVRREETTRG